MRIVVCPKWFGVEPSVPDGGSENLSQSESATPENILHRGVSPANAGRWSSVQNGESPLCGRGKREKLDKREK